MLLLLLLSRFSCVRLCAIPRTTAYQAPLSVGCSRQEYWSGLPLPSPHLCYTFVENQHFSSLSSWLVHLNVKSMSSHVSPRFLCPWDFPCKSVGVGCHFLLQGSSQHRDWTWVSCSANWATREFPYVSSIEKNNVRHRWSMYKWSTMQHTEILLFNASKYPLFKTLNMIEGNKEIKLF